MDLTSVLYTKEEGVARVTLNRPEQLNALDNAMQEDMTKIVEDLWQDESVRAVLFAGNGRAFSAGGDIKSMLTRLQQDNVMGRKEQMAKAHLWVKRFITLEKPVVAAVQGFAVGAGMSMAMMADLIVASDDAQFSPAFARIGFVPDLGGLFLLPRLVGMARAKELALTGKYLSSAEALQIGLINRVVKQEELADEAFALAKKLAQGPTKALGMTKAVLNKSMESSLNDILELETYLQAAAAATEDFQEGIKSFLEKRPPNFQGK